MWLRWFQLGCLLAMISVMLGAFAAHALADKITPEQLKTFETAVRYQMYHALAIIICALNYDRFGKRHLLTRALQCFALGSVLFCGSLYLLVLLGIKSVVWLTPLGGTMFILGWLFCMLAVVNTSHFSVSEQRP